MVEALCERFRVPSECRELAVLVARHHGDVHRAQELRAGTIVKLLEKTDALRRPERFERLLEACSCDFHGRTGFESREYVPASILRTALAAARAIDAGAIAGQQTDPRKIAAAVHEARVHAVEQAFGR